MEPLRVTAFQRALSTIGDTVSANFSSRSERISVHRSAGRARNAALIRASQPFGRAVMKRSVRMESLT